MSLRKSTDKKTEEQAAVFSALGDPTRLRLTRLLCRQSRGEALCVNALAAFLGITQSSVAHHLRVLKAIGLVQGTRRGYHVHYCVDRAASHRCIELLSAALKVETPGDEVSCEPYCPLATGSNNATK